MVPIGDCVPAALAALLRRQPLTPAKVAFVWRTAVGPLVDRATTVALGPGDVLRVEAEDGHWQREVERSQSLIQARLDWLLGPGIVSRLVVSTRRSGAPGEAPAGYPRAPFPRRPRRRRKDTP
jgi:hypothetical protein